MVNPPKEQMTDVQQYAQETIKYQHHKESAIQAAKSLAKSCIAIWKRNLLALYPSALWVGAESDEICISIYSADSPENIHSLGDQIEKSDLVPTHFQALTETDRSKSNYGEVSEIRIFLKKKRD